MATVISGDTGIDKITDGSVVADDLASTLDLSGKTITLATDAVDQLSTASGSAPSYSARAWVRFLNTTGTPSINASGNVSSITDEGVGRYTVNFTTAMPDIYYSTSVNCGDSATTEMMYGLGNSSFTPASLTTSCRFYTTNGSATFQDKAINSFVAFR